MGLDLLGSGQGSAGPGSSCTRGAVDLLMLSLEEGSSWEDLVVILGEHRESNIEKRKKIAPQNKTQDNE